jgi:hypothetical protein
MVEPEWDDHSRELAEALALHDHERCPGCGLHPSFLADPERHLALEDTYCDMCKAQARHGRIVHARDTEFEKKHKDAPPGTPRPTDGLHTRVKTLTPAEAAKRQKRRNADG